MSENTFGSNNRASKAIALKYDEITAPKLTAKGQSDLAEQIIQLAKEHNIPIYENSELVNILSKLELGDEIPETLYRVIAEIIAFAYHLQGKVPKGFET
jgi:flagellar biosynthesis protein